MQKLERVEWQPPKNELERRYQEENPDEEVWANDLYQVNVRRGIPFAGNPEFTLAHLSIKRRDRRALTDWRHFQWIKNDIVGEECEGIELFPAESRLVDGANQYHLWVFETPEPRWPVGWDWRNVTEKSLMGETQRKFPESRKPKDLKENEERFKHIKEDYLKGKGIWDRNNE
jgi:hypothetical protein